LTIAWVIPFPGAVRSVGLARVSENRMTDMATSAATSEKISDNLALFDRDRLGEGSLIA